MIDLLSCRYEIQWDASVVPGLTTATIWLAYDRRQTVTQVIVDAAAKVEAQGGFVLAHALRRLGGLTYMKVAQNGREYDLTAVAKFMWAGRLYAEKREVAQAASIESQRGGQDHSQEGTQ